MSSNLPIPGTGSFSLSESSGESERSFSNEDGLRRLRTGKRGRPPIDPTQKGLVERRRNQLRTAQRAYRSRKEEEAAIRTNYVQVLENRIEHMTQSFFELVAHVTKVEAALGQSDVRHELHSIARDFVSASQITEAFCELPRHDRHASYNHSMGDSNSTMSVGFPNNYTPCPTQLPLPATVPIETTIPILAAPLGLHPPFLQAEVPIPNNFAQRLYLTCIKKAYGLLTNPRADGAEAARVFQYSFRYSDANTMISTFDTLLRTNADYRSAYVYKMGGAGTHYKNRQAGLGIVQTVSLGQEMLSKEDEETWFDPRDIEGWLDESGLVIGGAQSFMYLSELRSFEPRRDESGASFSSQRDIRQSAQVLNVDRFLQELISRGVCLGGAPGFRRVDVEAAFRLAISDDMTFIGEP